MTESGIRPLPAPLAKIAQLELNENESRIPEDLQAIKSWLDKQPHIISRRDDQFLIAFLRGCKFSLERTKEKLDMYYTVKTACPEIYGQRDPLNPKIKALLDLGVTIPLPSNQTDCSRILISRPCDFDPKKVLMTDVLKVSFIIADFLMLEDDYIAVGGQTNIIDLKGMTMGHSAQLSFSFVKKIATSVQDAYPNRLKSFHFLNAPAAFDLIFKMFHHFLSEKLRKRVFMHNSLESLHAHVAKDLLPKEYGGNLESIEKLNNDLVSRIISKRDWYLEDIKYKTDESKRVGSPKNANILFGAEGSFRKLDID